MGARKKFTVIGLFDNRHTELLVAGTVDGHVTVTNTEHRSGGYERVYYKVEADTAALAEKAVQREVDLME